MHEKAKKLAANGQCVSCEAALVAGKKRLGLCSACYAQYYRALSSVPERDRDAFNEELIGRGLLFPAKLSRATAGNPFAEIARDMTANPPVAPVLYDNAGETGLESAVAEGMGKKRPKKKAAKKKPTTVLNRQRPGVPNGGA